MLGQPEVEVGLGANGEVAQDAALLDGLHHRQVDLVVPVGDGLLVGDLALLLQAHEVAMHLDVLLQHLVLPGHGDAEVGLGAKLVQTGALQELGILRLQDQLIRLNLRRQGHFAVHLGHVGLDVSSAYLAGHGDAVVTILHEIGVANAVHSDGRQAGQAGHRYLDPRPALAATQPGQEAAREIAVATHAADDGIEGDVGQLLPCPLPGAQLLAHLLVGEEIGRAASEAGHDLLQSDATAGLVEVVYGGDVAQGGCFVRHGHGVGSGSQRDAQCVKRKA